MFSRKSKIVHEHVPAHPSYPNPANPPPGLYLIPNFVTEAEEQEMVDFLLKNQWQDHMSAKRPTQHFGYKYLRSGGIDRHKKVAGDWDVLQKYADRLEKIFPGVKIGQVLANLYYHDTGIGAHRDKETDLIFGISLVGDINMTMKRTQNVEGVASTIKYKFLVPRRSLYIFVDDAALLWTHEISVTKSVEYPEMDPLASDYGKLKTKLPKGKEYIRISITFRDMNE